MIDQNTYIAARKAIAAGDIAFVAADAVITASGGVSVARVKELLQSRDARTAQYADELNDALTSRLRSDAYNKYVGLPDEAQPLTIMRGGVIGLTKQMPVEYGGIKSVDGGAVINKNADIVTRIDFVKQAAAAGELHKYVVPRVVTTAQVDRANDRVKPSGGRFENYAKNPVVLYAHDHAVVVGKSVAMQRKTDSIVLEHLYHGLDGQDGIPRLVAMLAMCGMLSADSIGFIPLAWDDKEKVTQEMVEQHQAYPFTTHIRTYTDWELLEDSLVAVPMNPGATSGKGMEKGFDACIERGLLSGDDVSLLLNSTNTNTTIEVKTMPEAATTTTKAADQLVVKHLILEDKTAQAVVDKALLGENILATAYMSVLCDLKWRLEMAVWDAVRGNRLDLLPEIFAEFAAVATRMASAILEPDEATMQELAVKHAAAVEERAGQVLSNKNKEILIKAIADIRQGASYIQEVLDSAAVEEAAPVAETKSETEAQSLGEYVTAKQYERDVKDIMKTLHSIKSTVEAVQGNDVIVQRAIDRYRADEDAAQSKQAAVETIIQKAISLSTT